MPPMHQNYSILLDLNASNASELFHLIGPQCLQCIRTIPYYWTSMPPMPQSYSIFWTLGDGDDGGGGGDGGGSGGGGFPRTLDIWRSLGPTCPGTKYPVRGIPHFDYRFHVWPQHQELQTMSFSLTCSSGIDGIPATP